MLLILLSYWPCTRLSWQETPSKCILGSRLWHATHSKQKKTKPSWQFILFVNASPTPQNHKKNSCRSKKYIYIWPFSWSIKVKGTYNLALISFIFPHKCWFLSWSSNRAYTHYIHLWSPRFPYLGNPRQNLFLGANTWASRRWHINLEYFNSKDIVESVV